MNKKIFPLALLLISDLLCAQPLLVDSNNEFTIDLYRARAKGPDNVVISPFSISCAMGMIYPGMRGEVATEVKQAFGFHKNANSHAQDFGQLLKQLNKAEGPLKISNSLWLSTKFSFVSSFLDISKQHFRAEVQNLNFGDREQASKAINDAVARDTKDKITDLIKPNQLDGIDQIIVLTNAMYFKESWQTPFKKDLTKVDRFFLSNGSSTDANFMFSKGRYNGLDHEHFTALELPYLKNEFSMLFILPKVAMEEFQDQFLTHDEYLEWHLDKVDFEEIRIPRFTIETETDAIPLLRGFGMKATFDGGNFTGMVETDLLVAINVIAHKALIEVNEEGTVAAAATAVGAVTKSVGPPKLRFNANKPFLFLLRHNPTKCILFIGKVENPTKAN